MGWVRLSFGDFDDVSTREIDGVSSFVSDDVNSRVTDVSVMACVMENELDWLLVDGHFEISTNGRALKLLASAVFNPTIFEELNPLQSISHEVRGGKEKSSGESVVLIRVLNL